MEKKVMKINQYKLSTIIFSTLLLVACQTGLNLEKTEKLPSLSLLAEVETNNIFTDGDNQHQVEGKNILLKLDQGCQLDRIFYSFNNQSVTYRYIFKNEKLVSASTITSDSRNNTWNDPEYEPTVKSFEQAKETFSKEYLKKCS